MTNFNPINNLNFVRLPSNNIKNTNLTEISDDNTLTNSNQNNNNIPLNKTFESINPALIYSLELAKMDNKVLVKYLQSLLSLPDSIDKFIQQLNSDSKDSQMLKILVENLIDTKALSEFLNQKSKVAIDKILQTISSSLKFGADESSQLKDILSILTYIQSQSSSNSNILKEFLLLYIPINGQIFDRQVEYNVEDNEEKETIKSQDLSIMFETLNFSNILCSLSAQNNDIIIYFYIHNQFPKEKFKNILMEFSKDININTFIDFKLKKETFNKANPEQNFKITSKSYISPAVLILSHLIIKIIFKIDSDFSI